MTTHETIRQLLALSAAGLLDAADERRVRQHVHECAACAAALDELAAVSADLCRLPAPMAPPDLLARLKGLDRPGDRLRSFEHGGVAVLLSLAQRLGVAELIDRRAGPPRAGRAEQAEPVV